MTSPETVKWISRIVVFALLTGLGLWCAKKLTTGGNGERRFGKALFASLKMRARVLVLVASGSLAVAALLPLADLSSSTAAIFHNVLDILWIVLAAWAATTGLNVIADLTHWKYDLNVEDNYGARQVHTKIRIFQRVLLVLIWLVALAGILMLFERFRALGGTLLASAGIASVVLGLSAQKTFGAIIAGVQVALSNPINIDDVVIVEGEWGRIEEITFTYAVVRIWDLRRLIVPLTYFLERPFQNWTRSKADLIGSVFLHADYTVPVDDMRQELERICEESRHLWDGKTCTMQVTDAGPETITLRALVSAANSSAAWDLRCLVREKLVAYLRDNHPGSLPRKRLRMHAEKDKDGLEY
ncbi:mechanosensitive ion channel family protein [Salidesulfovibrio brasiliensis]